jgi:tetraacyldisaccharide 4'-kinase
MLEKLWRIHAYKRRLWFLSLFCKPLSVFYRSLSYLKKTFFKFFPFLLIRTENPVIVIGNLTVGGTGKTPLTLFCLDYFLKGSRPLRLITRGYGAKFRGGFANFENGEWDRLGFFGDETESCARRFPQVSISVGKRRGESVARQSQKDGNEIMILDDAFQYWRLKQDFTLVTIHGGLIFGNGELFPHGPLRERPEAIKRASVVIIVYPVKPKKQYLELLANLGYTGPVFLANSYLESFMRLTTGESVEVDSKRVPWVLASSIAHPETFRTQIEDLGYSVARHFAFPDHYEYSIGEQRRILASLDFLAANYLCITEKDAPKWTLQDSRVLIARQSLSIDQEQSFLDILETYIQSKT